MSEIQNLNKVYEDETATVYIQDVYQDGSLLVLHVDVIPTTNREVLEHYGNIINSIYVTLAEKGVPEIETWCQTDEQIRFANHFGFDEMLGELTIDGETLFPPLYRIRKKLN